jgi:DNA methylase
MLTPPEAVKPVALMRWLCKLVTPPGGTILDCFAGSGSTLIAAVLEGFDAIGIDSDPEYAEIARRRIAHAVKHGERWLEAAKASPPEARVYGNGKGRGYKVPRCPEHDASLPSGQNAYRCGCPTVTLPADQRPTKPAPDSWVAVPLFAATEEPSS